MGHITAAPLSRRQQQHLAPQRNTNSTSFIYAAVIGIPLIIAAMIVLPFFGLDYEKFFNKESKDYDYTSGFDQDFSSYSSYAQRSLNTLTPIIKAIDQAYRKYK